ncbi:MAG TPA: beta-propeller fold lactonase family protein, partial [Candidatus Limnocylindrales bacterium]|nr:beta-propeller fold lactonase family protein [Candidatus Limnocylindrales bacterium]
MHRLARLVGLAGVLAALVATITAGTVGATGARTVGHLYVNNNSAGTNTIAGFNRHADGSLSPILGSPFTAGGAGTGLPFGSAGGLQETANGRFLLAADPASNQISVLRIRRDGSLALADLVSSNGLTPTSIAVHGSLVYVANGGA